MMLLARFPRRPDIPETEESRRLAREAQAAERAACTRQTGIRFDGDTPVIPHLTMQQLDCAEVVDDAVARFGHEAVLRALVGIAASDGVHLEVRRV